MEGDFQSGKSINSKMSSCAITNLWDSVGAMKKDLFIDLDKQELTNLLTGNKLKKILHNKFYYKIAFRKNKKVYWVLFHRLLFYWHHGYLPKLIDHKDTNAQNNNIENLRELNNSGNRRNSHKIKNCTSIYKGVCWIKANKKWRAKFTLNGKDIHLGYFDNEDDAGQAYNDAVRKHNLEEVSVMNDTPQERARK
jgi:HNH endonuclease/AP2 domain